MVGRCADQGVMTTRFAGTFGAIISLLPAFLATQLLLHSPAARAELTLRPGMTGVADLGASSCATFNAMYPNGPTGLRQAALYYAEGYIFAKSGKSLEAVLAELPEDTDWRFDSLTDVIVGYCAENPESTVSEATAMLWRELGG